MFRAKVQQIEFKPQLGHFPRCSSVLSDDELKEVLMLLVESLRVSKSMASTLDIEFVPDPELLNTSLAQAFQQQKQVETFVALLMSKATTKCWAKKRKLFRVRLDLDQLAATIQIATPILVRNVTLYQQELNALFSREFSSADLAWKHFRTQIEAQYP